LIYVKLEFAGCHALQQRFPERPQLPRVKTHRPARERHER
jgi:hypothetical protein